MQRRQAGKEHQGANDTLTTISYMEKSIEEEGTVTL